LTVLGKAHEFFRICDLEGKGFITRQDMQRLHPELPLSLEQLEKVFVTLDADGNGSLTPKEFTTGFSEFGKHVSCIELYSYSILSTSIKKHFILTVHLTMHTGSQTISYMDFSLPNVPACTLDPYPFFDSDLGSFQMWVSFYLLAGSAGLKFAIRMCSFAHTLTITDPSDLSIRLFKKIAAYDEEIQHLYEEMEQQIKKEKEQFLLKDTERFQSYSQELECKLLSKEQELEQLVQKQKRLEQQCTELLSGKEETKVENTKLKLTNQELLRDLERTSHELSLAQEQLQVLQEEASRLHEEKEM
ncbi:EFC4B protein, partial [Pygoscelis papua]